MDFVWWESTARGEPTANTFCMVRHQPSLASSASPQAQGSLGRSWCPGPHCSKCCSAVSLLLSAHVPVFSARHFPRGSLLLGSAWVLPPGGPQCRAAPTGMALPVCKLQHRFKQLSPRGIQRVLGGPFLGGTKGDSFQERTLQTPCHTVATHLRFTKSAFLCGSKEKA